MTSQIKPITQYDPKLIQATCDWVGLTWSVLPRTITPFLPIIPNLINSADDLYIKNNGTDNGRALLIAKLELINRKAVEEKIWADSTSKFAGGFLELSEPGDKEGYIAILLASIIARNLDCHRVVFHKKAYKTDDDLETAIKNHEIGSINSWLQRTWQCRFQDISPNTNTRLKWNETTEVIQEVISNVLSTEKEFTEDVLHNIRKLIHNKMRERKLWKNEFTGVVEHDVDFEHLGRDMYDNYTIMALVGLVAISEHKID